MKKMLLNGIILVLFIIFIVPMVSAENVLKNGGFEQWSGGAPNYFSVSKSADIQQVTDPSVVRSGTSALKVLTDTVTLSQEVDVVPGENYWLISSVRVDAPATQKQICAKVFWYRADGSYFGDTGGSCAKWWYGGNDWTPSGPLGINIGPFTSPPDAAKGVVTFGSGFISGWTEIPGPQYYDDFTFVSSLEGSISVFTSPPTAQIWIDGNLKDPVSPQKFDGIEAGTHTVKVHLTGYVDAEKTVFVNYGETTPVEFQLVAINAPITTNVKIVPKTINLGSKGYFLAFVTLPDAYKGATIDMKTVSCSGAPAVRMMKLKFFPRMVGFVFKTSALNNVEVGKRVTLTVKGEMKNKGTTYTFTGSDDVKVISKPSWQPDDIKDISKFTDDQLFKKYSF